MVINKRKTKEKKEKNTFAFKLLTFIFKTTTLTFRLLLYKLQSQLLMIFLKNSRRGSLTLKDKTFQRQTASLAVSLNASFLALNFTQLHSVSFGFIRFHSAYFDFTWRHSPSLGFTQHPSLFFISMELDDHNNFKQLSLRNFFKVFT